MFAQAAWTLRIEQDPLEGAYDFDVERRRTALDPGCDRREQDLVAAALDPFIDERAAGGCARTEAGGDRIGIVTVDVGEERGLGASAIAQALRRTVDVEPKPAVDFVHDGRDERFEGSLIVDLARVGARCRG
jgi:hypothetical protein